MKFTFQEHLGDEETEVSIVVHSASIGSDDESPELDYSVLLEDGAPYPDNKVTQLEWARIESMIINEASTRYEDADMFYNGRD